MKKALERRRKKAVEQKNRKQKTCRNKGVQIISSKTEAAGTNKKVGNMQKKEKKEWNHENKKTTGERLQREVARNRSSKRRNIMVKRSSLAVGRKGN